MSYRLIEKQVIYRGQKVQLELHRLENQETEKRHTREVCVHPGAVAVLGLLDDHKIVLIRTFRYAIGQYLYELPAGTLEKGEDPLNCGRELLEETGYLAGRLQPLVSFYTSPGILSEKLYVFTAYDLQHTETALEEGEDIAVHPMALDEAMEMIHDGRIQDAKTIAGVLYYASFRKDAH